MRSNENRTCLSTLLRRRDVLDGHYFFSQRSGQSVSRANSSLFTTFNLSACIDREVRNPANFRRGRASLNGTRLERRFVGVHRRKILAKRASRSSSFCFAPWSVDELMILSHLRSHVFVLFIHKSVA